MKTLIKAEIKDGEILECISTQAHKSYKTIFIHLISNNGKACGECNRMYENICRQYIYHNLEEFLNDREILEGMIK